MTFCVLADRLECAELLLKAGAQVNLKDNGGRTALHWAAHKVHCNFDDGDDDVVTVDNDEGDDGEVDDDDVVKKC